jgi:hypothetical protein
MGINSTDMIFKATMPREKLTEYLLMKMARVTCPEKMRNSPAPTYRPTPFSIDKFMINVKIIHEVHSNWAQPFLTHRAGSDKRSRRRRRCSLVIHKAG